MRRLSEHSLNARCSRGSVPWLVVAISSSCFALIRPRLNVSLNSGTLIGSHEDRGIQEMIHAHLPNWTEAPRFKAPPLLRAKASKTAFLMAWESAGFFKNAMRGAQPIRPLLLLIHLAASIAGAAILLEFNAVQPRQWKATILDGDVSAQRALIHDVSKRLAKSTYVYMATKRKPGSLSLPFDGMFTYEIETALMLAEAPPLVVHVEPTRRKRQIKLDESVHVGLVTDNFVDKDVWEEAIAEIASQKNVASVHIRVHPRSKLKVPDVADSRKIVTSSPSRPLAEFAEEVDIAIVSRTSAAQMLRLLGVPCFTYPRLNPNQLIPSEELCVQGNLSAFFRSVHQQLTKIAIPSHPDVFPLPLSRIRSDSRNAIEELLLAGFVRWNA